MLFVECTVNTVQVDSENMITNVPVNLELCGSISISVYSIPPDKYGDQTKSASKPALIFNGCDATWVFPNDRALKNELHQLKASINSHQKLTQDALTRLSMMQS